jgi:hypothetical protein
MTFQLASRLGFAAISVVARDGASAMPADDSDKKSSIIKLI